LPRLHHHDPHHVRLILGGQLDLAEQMGALIVDA